MWVGVTFGGLEWSKAAPMTPFRGVVVLPTIIAVVGIGILASELDNITRFLLPMPEFIAQLMAEIISGGAFAVIALVIVAPLTEELLFRGLILQGFLGRYSTVTAVLVSALLFTLVHMNPYQVASAWLMGIYLAWLFILTRSLWPCIIAHALFNSQAIVIPLLRDHFGLQISGYTGPPVPGQPEFQPLWFNVLGMVLVALGLWLTAITAGNRKFASPPD
jgi:membrane protease YdiL (CAAX protease family)